MPMLDRPDVGSTCETGSADAGPYLPSGSGPFEPFKAADDIQGGRFTLLQWLSARPSALAHAIRSRQG
jgi:hypothetical protein